MRSSSPASRATTMPSSVETSMSKVGGM
jgi:hypothetical protein